MIEEKSKVPNRPNSLWAVRDADTNAWGPFSNAEAARAWAKAKWPDIPEWDEDLEGLCWDVEALWTPN